MKGIRPLGAMPFRRALRLGVGATYWTTRAYKKYGLPSVRMSDGPHGLRMQERGGGFGMLGVKPSRPATCFPCAATLASSWDESLLESVGRAIGEEARAQGVGVVLGPGLNIKRSPLCGRGFEYYSEDPLLSGKLAAAMVRGIQGTGVAACLKHFAANSQERERFLSDSVMDERTLREIYLPGFETAVREGRPRSVMCAYNKLNGVYCSDNRTLLTDILRGEWGFDGAVMTDWGGMHDRSAAYRAGCDLCMPGGGRYGERETLRGIRRGELDAGCVRESVRRVAALARGCATALSGARIYDATAHHELALRAACAGAVLLKNEGLLPLRPGVRAAVIGHMARESRYQGTGSSRINPMRLTHPADNLPLTIYAQGCDADGNTTPELLSRAVLAAREAECAIVFAGLTESCESEGFDREDMRLPEGMNELINAVAAANPRTCVLLFGGAPMECPWTDKAAAVLCMGLPGEAAGEAAAELLYGRAEPGGRLAESWPRVYEDSPSSECFSKSRDALYYEGLYVGYRYYASALKAPRWPFGHGLGYTSWEYSDISVGEGRVSFRLKNTGSRPGSETPQLYIEPPRGGLHRPRLELRGFRRLTLQPGESRLISFELTERSFALWQDGWRVPGGRYTLHIGASSADLRLSAQLDVEGEELAAPEWQSGSWYETFDGKPTRSGWERMLAREYVSEKRDGFDMDSTPYELRRASLLGRAFYGGMRAALALGYGGGRAKSAAYRMVLECSVYAPLRVLQINGGVPGIVFKALLKSANRKSKKRRG